MIRAVDLFDDQIRDDVVVTARTEAKPRLRIQLGDVIGRALHVLRADGKSLRQLAPTVRDQLIKCLVDETIRQSVAVSGGTQLQQQALAQIAGANSRRIKILNHLQHRDHIRVRIRRDIATQVVFLGPVQEGFVRTVADLRQRAGDPAVVGDIADEFVGEKRLTRRQIEQRQLLGQMIGQVLGVNRDRLVVLALFVLFALTTGLETVEQYGFPIDVIVAGLLRLRLGGGFGLGEIGRFRLLFTFFG